MKNLKKVSKATQKATARDRWTWVPLYYSIKNDAVYTTEGDDRLKVTELINPNTEQEIRETVEAWKRL